LDQGASGGGGTGGRVRVAKARRRDKYDRTGRVRGTTNSVRSADGTRGDRPRRSCGGTGRRALGSATRVVAAMIAASSASPSSGEPAARSALRPIDAEIAEEDSTSPNVPGVGRSQPGPDHAAMRQGSSQMRPSPSALLMLDGSRSSTIVTRRSRSMPVPTLAQAVAWSRRRFRRSPTSAERLTRRVYSLRAALERVGRMADAEMWRHCEFP
jgi:hypothetical protein